MSSLNAGINNQEYFGNPNLELATTSGAGLRTIVSPSENTGGLIVYLAAATSASSSGQCSVSTGSSAPTSYTDGVILTICIVSSQNYTSMVKTTYPLFIPAGNGLYCSHANGDGRTSIIYEAL